MMNSIFCLKLGWWMCYSLWNWDDECVLPRYLWLHDQWWSGGGHTEDTLLASSFDGWYSVFWPSWRVLPRLGAQQVTWLGRSRSQRVVEVVRVVLACLSLPKNLKNSAFYNSCTMSLQGRFLEGQPLVGVSPELVSVSRHYLSFVPVKITLFYIIYYAFLAGFFTLMLLAFFQTLDDRAPTWQNENSLIGSNPGMGFRPHPEERQLESTLIWFRAGSQNGNWENWVERLGDFIKVRNLKEIRNSY